MHTLQQHDGVRCDLMTEELLAKHGLGGTRMDAPFRTMKNPEALRLRLLD